MNKKRFYKTVTVAPFENEFAVMLDGKPIKTPVGTVLRGSEVLANAMAAEWESQTEIINPDKMPITRIVSIARDRVPQDRALLMDDIVNYAGSDLLCYRAPYESVIPAQAGISLEASASGEGDSRLRGNDNLRDKQEQLFTPVLDWAASLGIHLHVTDSVMPITQPEASLAKVRDMVSDASDLELAALAMAVPLLGSAMLALAIWKGALSVDDAIACARVDEDFQAAKWGQDPEAKAQWLKREVDIRGAAVVLAEKLNGD